MSVLLAEPVELDLERLDADDAPFVHLVRPAAECEPPRRLPASIFAPVAPGTLRRMAASLKQHGRTGHDAVFKVERVGDITRGQRVQREDTPEWREREAARRARQTVPKPTGYRRQKSRKLRELIGDE